MVLKVANEQGDVAKELIDGGDETINITAKKQHYMLEANILKEQVPVDYDGFMKVLQTHKYGSAECP